MAQATNFDQSRKATGTTWPEAAKQKQYDAVIQEAKPVRRMYPKYVGAPTHMNLVAAADLAKGDKKAAEAILIEYSEDRRRRPGHFLKSSPHSRRNWASQRKRRRP